MKTAEGPKITAIAPWFGGKRTLAPRIVQELGKHRAYWEPFCGSMAVLFAKEPCPQETVNDLHGALVNLARVLADESMAVDLYGRASRTLYSTDLYSQSRQYLDDLNEVPDVADIESAYHFLVCSWMGRNGTCGCARMNWQPSIRYTPGGGASPLRWRNAVESIPWWHERLRNVAILRRDAFGLLGDIADVPGVVIYADPPYVKATRGKGGGSRYLHDFNEESSHLLGEHNDHERLAGALRRFGQARVIVSYYDHPRIRELYAGWTVIECTMQKNLHVQNRRGVGACEAPEILLVNGPSLGGAQCS